ncbi:MAG: GtrA family protein [Planctomycetota bacterium]
MDEQTTGTPREDRPAAAGASAFARFLAVGPVGVALGAAQYELLWRINPLEHARGATTWAASFLIGVAWVHALHVRFTFRAERRRGYWSTLPQAYFLYSFSAGLGVLAMYLAVDLGGVHRFAAWLATTAGTSLVNFVLLRRLLTSGRTSAGERA